MGGKTCLTDNVKCREQNVGDKKPLSSLRIWHYSINERIDLVRVCIFTQHKPDNPHETHAVAVKRVQDQGGMPQIVGHVPLTLSRVFHLFLKHGGQISVEVTGKQRKKGIGLEINIRFITRSLRK